MAKDMILVDRAALLYELGEVFDERTAGTLLSVLDKVATQVHAVGVSREKTPSYFGRWLRHSKVVDLNSLWDQLEASLTEEELEQVSSALDLIVAGTRKTRPEGGKLYLAVEISSVVDTHDVQRARQRAELLHKAGIPAIPVAAGETMIEEAEDQRQRTGRRPLTRWTACLVDNAGIDSKRHSLNNWLSFPSPCPPFPLLSDVLFNPFFRP